MIRNGLYLYRSKALDGVVGGDTGVMVIRDGALRGGTSFFYFVGSYTCADGKWKGELVNLEHTPAPVEQFATARKEVSTGWSGTYTDDGADVESTALVGKRSIRFHASLRLLVAD